MRMTGVDVLASVVWDQRVTWFSGIQGGCVSELVTLCRRSPAWLGNNHLPCHALFRLWW